MQLDLNDALDDGRYPQNNAPIEERTAERMKKILPNPEHVVELEKYFCKLVDAQWVQEFHRLLSPAPAVDQHPNLRIKKLAAMKNPADNEGDDDGPAARGEDEEPHRTYPAYCGVEYLLSFKGQAVANPIEGLIHCQSSSLQYSIVVSHLPQKDVQRF